MSRALNILLSVDRFLLWLIATVVLASLLPARGAAVAWVDLLADLAIVLLFFLHGAKLSREAIVQGIGNWRLHALTLGSTYILFPAIGLLLVWQARGLVDPLLLSGLLYLTLVPSTVQSSIAFTAMAGGNVAAAVCSASLSNLAGLFLTPVLVGVFMQVAGGGVVSSAHSVWAIALQLLLPFLAGHLMRPLIGGLIDRNKAILMPVDRGSILLVVYSAFGAAVIGGIWTKVGTLEVITLLLLGAAILGLVLGINALIAGAFSLPREDMIVLLFCGSKKSLVSGVPMAGALFPSAQVGLIVLPLIIFHQLQLFVCAALAGYFRRQGERLAADMAAPALPPRTAEEIAAAAAARGLVVPDACLPGVINNLNVLSDHADILRAGPTRAMP